MGMRKLPYAIAAFTLYALSLGLLGFIFKTLPTGITYAVWSGLGTAAIATVGILYFDESVSYLKFLFIILILVGCVGLNLLSDTNA